MRPAASVSEVIFRSTTPGVSSLPCELHTTLSPFLNSLLMRRATPGAEREIPDVLGSARSHSHRMLQISKRRLAGLGALMTLAALPSTATAAPKTHVFKMDLTVNVSTEWVSHSENSVCSDWNRVLHGEGGQHLTMKAQRRLVTFRGGKLAYPGHEGHDEGPRDRPSRR